RSAAGAEAAIADFQHAIAADSSYAAAWAGLAHYYAVLTLYGGGPGIPLNTAATLSLAAARRAVSLDDSLPDAHTELGFILALTNQSPAAEQELLRAIALDPNYRLAREDLAYVYANTGRTALALAETRRELAVDPLSAEANANLA